jgi:hypothetical protein
MLIEYNESEIFNLNTRLNNDINISEYDYNICSKKMKLNNFSILAFNSNNETSK